VKKADQPLNAPFQSLLPYDFGITTSHLATSSFFSVLGSLSCGGLKYDIGFRSIQKFRQHG